MLDLAALRARLQTLTRQLIAVESVGNKSEAARLRLEIETASRALQAVSVAVLATQKGR